MGVDAWGLGDDGVFTGMGQYTASLLRWTPKVAPVEMVAYGAPGEDRPGWLPEDVAWRPVGAPLGRLSAIASRTCLLQRALADDDIDLFHCPGVHVRPSSPPVPSVRCPLVVTMHDVIPLSFYGPSLPNRNRRFYSWNLGRAMKADRILTVSESAKADIITFTNIEASDVDVVTSAVDFAPNRDRSALVDAGIHDDYLLYAGSYEPRKNLVAMLRAFEAFRTAGGAQMLVAITERSSGHESAVRSTLASLRCRDDVRLLHGVPDGALRALYTHASAVVFPSLAEGLGLPAIQAAACGVPIVASDLPALRETVGQIAVLSPPGDHEKLVDALVRVTTERCLRDKAARLGPAIAARFSPETFAVEHAQVYRSCLERRHARV